MRSFASGKLRTPTMFCGMVALGFLVVFLLDSIDGGQADVESASTAIEAPSQPDESLYLTNADHMRTLVAGTEQLVIDVGDIRAGSQTPVSFYLKNGTEHDLQIIEIASSCGCIVGESERRTIPQGGGTVINATLRPHSIVDLFEQKLTLHFFGGAIAPKDILLRAHVKGDVGVSPTTLRFIEDQVTQVLEVTAEAEDIRLTSFEAMSSVMQIQETEFVSDSMVRLHVTPTISSGQAIELLRVHYVDETSNREEKIAELKIGFSTSKDYRFIPSSVQLRETNSDSISRVFLAFSGRYCPADEVDGEIFIRLKSGEKLRVPDSAIQMERRKRRLFEFRIHANKLEVPAGAQGLVAEFSGREFLLPIINEEG